MAITISQQPSSTLFVPVNNPIEYLVNSTSTAQPNFKLSCKVIVGGTEIKELMYDVIPSTAFIIAEIQKLLDNGYANLDSVLLTQSTGAVSLSPMNQAVPTTNIVFQEFYSSSVTANPTYQGTQASGTNIYVYNSAFKYREWVANDWHDYSIIQDGVNAQRNAKMLSAFTNYVENTGFTNTGTQQSPNALTKSLNFRKVTPAQFMAINYQVIGSTSNQFLHTFRFYDSALTLNTSPEPEYVQSITNASSLKRFFLQTWNLNTLGSTSASLWNQVALTAPLTSSNTKYIAHYILRATDTAGVWRPATAVYLYEIDWDACSKYESYELHWVNHLGGWDSWVFNKRSNKQVIVDRAMYVQPRTRRISGSTIVHDQYARKKGQFYTGISERYEVNSDLLKDWEYDGLLDMLQSPNVYWKHPDYGFIAINILEQETINIPRQLNDKAYNINFVFEVQNFDKLQ